MKATPFRLHISKQTAIESSAPEYALQVFLIFIFSILITVSHRTQSTAQLNERFLILPEGGNMLIYARNGGYFVVNRNKFLNADMQKNFEKLSSGLRIVNPSDDPSGFAVAEKMKTIILEVRRRAVNEEDMRNYLRYLESALAQDSAILDRMRELSIKASSGILGEEDRELIQVEVAQLIQAIDHNALYNEYNKKKIMADLTSANLGISGINVALDPGGAIRLADAAADRIRKMRSLAGTESNALEFRIKGRNYYYVNLQAAESAIRDLNMAEEISMLMKNYTLLKFEYGLILKGKTSFSSPRK